MRLTLAEQVQLMEGTTHEERLQNLVAYLFQGAPVDFGVLSWKYLVQQFVVLYYNREMNTFHVEQFRTMLIGEIMRYKTFIDEIGNGLLTKVAEGGFEIREELARMIKEDRDRTGATNDNSNATRTDALEGETSITGSKLDKTVEDATVSQTTTEDIDDLTTGVGSGTEKGTDTNVTSENTVGNRKNTGTQTTDRTGTEDRTGNLTGSTEGENNSKTVGTNKGDSTVATDREGRVLQSNTPQSMVNASTTGLAQDVSWQYASKLDDNINHEKAVTTDNGESDSTTTGSNETSTVQNTSDKLVLDTQDKMTDNRNEDSTGARDSNSTGTTDRETTSDTKTEYSRDGVEKVEAESGSNSTLTGTSSEAGTRKEDRTQTEVGSKTSSLTMDELLDRKEDVTRVVGKLTPLEGNTKLFQFFMDYMEEPVMRVVQNLDKLFLGVYPPEERWQYLTWQERESCVGKL